MRPNIIRKVDFFPLTDTGKIDTNALLNSISKREMIYNVPEGMCYEINKRIFTVISRLAEENNIYDSIDMNSRLADLGINSLLFIKLLIQLEQEFGIEFDDAVTYDNVGTVEEMCKIIYSSISYF